MITTLCFGIPARFSPAVTAVAAHFGGMELDSEGGREDYDNYALKSPKELSNEEVLAITEEVAALHGVSFVAPANPENFSEVLLTVRSVTEAIAGQEPGSFESTVQFNPKHTWRTEQLIFGLLTKCGDGNNLRSAATYNRWGLETNMAYMGM